MGERARSCTGESDVGSVKRHPSLRKEMRLTDERWSQPTLLRLAALWSPASAGVYELFLVRIHGCDEMHPVSSTPVYVGRSNNLRRRMCAYCSTGSHLKHRLQRAPGVRFYARFAALATAEPGCPGDKRLVFDLKVGARWRRRALEGAGRQCGFFRRGRMTTPSLRHGFPERADAVAAQEDAARAPPRGSPRRPRRWRGRGAAAGGAAEAAAVGHRVRRRLLWGHRSLDAGVRRVFTELVQL